MEKKYIVYGGDVDALWVENMNSVMDDNHLMTLANDERICLQKHCAMLFEVNKWLLQYRFWYRFPISINAKPKLHSTTFTKNFIKKYNKFIFVWLYSF